MDATSYGVNLSQEITPLIVRDAIIECFEQAHDEILTLMDDYAEWSGDDERNRFRDLKIEHIIKDIFNKSGVDFNNPTKQNLYLILDNLVKFASQFRKPEIIQKHYDELRNILDRCKE